MAKTSALTRFAPRPVIITMPRRGGRLRRAARGVGRAARHVGRRVRHSRSLAPISLAVGGLAVGYADGKGFLDKLPPIAGSRMVTLGIAGFIAIRYLHSPMLKAAGYAALGAASYAVGNAQAKGGTSGDGGAGDNGGY
jgi:hypothetical protein